MATESPQLPPIQALWREALKDYANQLSQTGQQADLDRWKDVRDVDDLANRLKLENQSFADDAGRGSKFTSAMKTAFAPVTLIMNMIGGPASAAFAPCSQIFGAVAVLITAAQNTGAAFDDLAALFLDLGESTQLLKPLEKRRPPPELESIMRGVLVCLLTTCALATKRVCHVPEKARHRSVKQVLSGVKSNVGEFGRQLFLGGDGEINAAKASLQRLAKAQARMVGALTLEKVGDIQEDMTRIESVVVDIKGMNLQINTAIFDLQTDGKEIKPRLREIREVVAGIDLKLNDIQENMATKAGQKEIMSLIIERFDRAERLGPGFTRSAKAELPKAALMHSRRLVELKAILKPVSANRAHYTRIAESEMMPGTGDWILQHDTIKHWLAGRQPLLFIAAYWGCGKTFLAARIVKYLLESFKSEEQSSSPTSIAYFFVNREQEKRQSLKSVFRTAAFQIAQTSPGYASYLDAKFKEASLDDYDIEALWLILFIGFFGQSRGTAFLIVDGLDDTDFEESHSFSLTLKNICTGESGRKWTDNLRVLFTCQSTDMDGGEVVRALGSTAAFLELDAEDFRDDVAKVIDQKMRSAWGTKMVTPTLYTEVQQTLLSAPQCDFFWACSVVDDLTSMNREDAILDHLKRLPEDMDSTTLLILRRLSTRQHAYNIEDFNDIVAWVGLAWEPISLATLDAILTLRSRNGARLINLDHLIKNEFKGLFLVTTNDTDTYMRSAKKVEQRLGREHHPVDDTVSVAWTTDATSDREPAETGILSNVDNLVGPNITEFDRTLQSWSRTFLRLNHRLLVHLIITQEIEESLEQIPTDKMCSRVLWGCLETFCYLGPDHSRETVDTACKYCAVYLLRELCMLKPEDVGAVMMVDIIGALLMLFRDDTVLDRWIAFAGQHMVEELLCKDRFRERAMSWFENRLTSTEVGNVAWSYEAAEWVTAAEEATVATLFRPLALRFAKRWLRTECEDTQTPTEFLKTWLKMVRLVFFCSMFCCSS